MVHIVEALEPVSYSQSDEVFPVVIFAWCQKDIPVGIVRYPDPARPAFAYLVQDISLGLEHLRAASEPIGISSDDESGTELSLERDISGLRPYF